MSRLSPYRKQPNPNKKQHSPHTTHFQYSNSYIPNDRQHFLQTPIDQNKHRYYKQQPNISYKLTQKKKNDNINSIEFQSLLQKNRSLAKENAEIYELLQERGRIVNELQKKLEQQIYREVTTLEMIEKEKNKFIIQTQKKFGQYQKKIEELIRQIHILNQQKYSYEIAKTQQMEGIKHQLNKEQLIQLHNFANDQMTAREFTQQQNNKIKQMLSLKNNEIDELSYDYKSTIDKLKNEIISLNNEILHINHLRKIQLSQQKILYDNMLDNIMKQNAKQKELMQVQHDIIIKKLQKQITTKVLENSKIAELKKINQIQKNIRQNQLLQRKGKLEEEIKELQHFYRLKNKQQDQNRKQINKTEVQTISHGNQALVKNLKSEIEKLIKVNQAKTEEINSLYVQIDTQRQNNNEQIKNLQKFIKQLKNRMQQMERIRLVEQEQLKIRWAQLSQTNIISLKQFYQHQLQIVNQQHLQKQTLAENNRQKLHFQLKDKNQLKKRYDIEMLKASARITELQLQLSQMIFAKREQTSSLSVNVQLTSEKLVQQSKDRQKLSQNNQQDKRRLHELILAKDQQIEELNHKIQLLRQNYQNQIEQKVEQLQMIKKQKEDVQTELKKQKLFYENELKKKEIISKQNKEHFQQEYSLLKQRNRIQYDQMQHQLQLKINELSHELNHMKSVQKNLGLMIESLKEQQSTQLTQKQNELANEKQRMSKQKKLNEQKLQKSYQQQIARLKSQIQDLNKRLEYRNQDLNRANQKYHLLELKMQAVMESQQKLRNLQEKILNMGQNNNLVQNIAELVKIQITQ